MRIISTTATAEQQKQDYKKLLAAHKKAVKEVIFWDVFGGVITINGRRYQVVDK
jgi:hypothetical protein